MEPTFGKIPGCTKWVRKDREHRVGGVVAACLPQGMEALFFRVVLNDNTGLLLCVPPPRQGRSGLDFLTGELDTLLQLHKCFHIMIVGDLNFHLEQDALNSLLPVQGLENHVSIPTHERGG